MMIIIVLNPGYPMVVTPTTKYPFISLSPSHLFLWYAISVVGLWFIILENLKVGWALQFSRTQKYNWRVGVSQLLRAYNDVQMHPFAAIQTWHTLEAIHFPYKYWLLHSLTIYSTLQAIHVLFCCNSHDIWCSHWKIKTHGSHCWWNGTSSPSLNMMQRCHVF